jgi:hypothetical protein
MDETRNKLKARGRGLKLIKDSFHPGGELGGELGDKLRGKMVETNIGSRDVAAQVRKYL